jgi:hypothetical protein
MTASPSPGCTVYSVPATGDAVGAAVDGVGDGDPEGPDGPAPGEAGTDGDEGELDGVPVGSAPPQAARITVAARSIGPRRLVRIGQLGW